jgi:general secretion pathway protein G
LKHAYEYTDDGFTFLETLIVLAITVILSAGIGVSALQQIERAKRTAARSQIETLRICLQSYYTDCNDYPNADQGLEALFEKPVLSPVPDNWAGPYTERKIPTDPWGHPYVYKKPGSNNLPYSISSYGADRKEGGSENDKDVNSWE